MKRNLLILLGLLITLGSCAQNSNSSLSTTDNASSSTTFQPTNLTSVKSAFQALASPNANYVMSVSFYTEDISVDHFDSQFIVTPDYYLGGGSTGYLEENGGVSSVYVDEGQGRVYRSELLKKDDGSSYSDYREIIQGFFSIPLEKIPDSTEKVVNITEKGAILSIFDVIGIPRSQYVNSPEVITAIDGTFLTDFTIEISLNDGMFLNTYFISFSDIGIARNDLLQTYVDRPDAPFEPTEEEKKIRSLFKLNNYLQKDDIDGDDIVDQENYFTMDYFYSHFTEEFAKKDPLQAFSYEKGFIGIENKTLPFVLGKDTSGQDVTKDLIFNGPYSFTLTTDNKDWKIDTREDPENPGHAQPTLYSTETDITLIMNYPSNLSIFNNFQFFDEEEKGIYKTSYAPLIKDYIVNFNLTEAVQNMKIDSLEIEYIAGSSDSDTSVNFLINFNGGAFYYSTSFSNFGSTSYAPVEDILVKYKLK